MASILSQNFGPNWLFKALQEDVSSAFFRQHQGQRLCDNARERRWWEPHPTTPPGVIPLSFLLWGRGSDFTHPDQVLPTTF